MLFIYTTMLSSSLLHEFTRLCKSIIININYILNLTYDRTVISHNIVLI